MEVKFEIYIRRSTNPEQDLIRMGFYDSWDEALKVLLKQVEKRMIPLYGKLQRKPRIGIRRFLAQPNINAY